VADETGTKAATRDDAEGVKGGAVFNAAEFAYNLVTSCILFEGINCKSWIVMFYSRLRSMT